MPARALDTPPIQPGRARRRLPERLGRLLLKDGLPRLAANGWRRLVALAELVNKERKYLQESDLPLATRFGMWRRGFLSESFTIYRLGDPARAASYLSDYGRYARAWGINRPFEHVLNDKLVFWGLLRGFSPHIAPVAGLVRDGRLFRFRPEGEVASNLADLGELGDRLVLKPISASGGRGILLYERDGDGRHRVNRASCTLDELRATVGRDGFLVCPFVEQAAYAARIFPEVANTVRVLTLYDDERQEAFVAAAAHRFGRRAGGAVVDNWVQGGLAAAVDLAAGTLGTAYPFPRRGRLEPHAAHPDTGAAIEGVGITNWAVIRDGVVALASRLPFLPYVGWDVIPTDGGFAIIEGNNRPAANIVQLERGLLADPRVESFYRRRGVL
jgi:hypothetical protein